MENTFSRTSRSKTVKKEAPAAALNLRIKRILNDVIDVAYADASPGMRARYKHFKLYIESDTRKSINGKYMYEDSSIHVYNVYRDARVIAITCLHELAHHIDRMKRGESDHQKPFYEEYTKLIHAALSMKLLKQNEDILQAANSTDRKKVQKIIDTWVPQYVTYKGFENKLVKVQKGYKKRDVLKERGYRWNSLEQIWEKEISSDEEDAEREFLKKQELVAEISQTGMMFEAVVPLYARGETYAARELLRKYGFRFDKEKKCWIKKVKSCDVKKEADDLNGMHEFMSVRFEYES